MSDRLPPHNEAAEQGLLGCILLDSSKLNEIRANIADPEGFFFDHRHAEIYRALCAMADSNLPIDSVTLTIHLKSAGKLEAVGGIPYVTALADATPSAANLEYFAQTLEELSALRRLLQACTRTMQAVYEGKLDGETIISQAEREILAARQQRKSKTPSTPEIVGEALSEIERLFDAKGKTGGIPTGLVDLDYITDGLHNDEMIVVAAYPGVGKSALAMNIAEHVSVNEGKPVGVFSLEMSAKRLMMRLLASRGRVNLRSIKSGDLSQADFKGLTMAAAQFTRTPIHFCDIADMTISQLRSKARQMVQQHGIKFFVIDYLQLLTSPGKKDQSREQEVATISRGIKMMAQEFGTPVMVLSQLNDDGKLRESRAIGQDADTIWYLRHKDDQQAGNAHCPMVLDIKKQRDGEAPAYCDLMFLKPFIRFECVAREMPSDI